MERAVYSPDLTSCKSLPAAAQFDSVVLRFFRSRFADMWQHPSVHRAELPIVEACLHQAQLVIRSAPNDVRIVIILTVVFPKTNLTNIITTPLGERSKTAAWTPI
jgi:hypothetical protein